MYTATIYYDNIPYQTRTFNNLHDIEVWYDDMFISYHSYIIVETK